MAEPFSVTVGSEGASTVISIRGNVDWATCAMVESILEAVVAQGHAEIVLDFEQVRFIDASGIGAIAAVAARLALASGALSIRSVPMGLSQTLQLMDLAGIVFETKVASLGSEQQPGDGSAVGFAAPSSRSALVGAGARPDEASVFAALRRTTVLAARSLDAADGVSVILRRSGRMETVAASDDTIERMDEHQIVAGEGPCLSAAAEGRWFHVESLTGERRWPAFVPRAAHEGIASILSSPLRTARGTVGAFNIYSSSEQAFARRDQELAALYATHASGLVVPEGDDAATAARIAGAL